MTQKKNTGIFELDRLLFYTSLLGSIVVVCLVGPYHNSVRVSPTLIGITEILDPLLVQLVFVVILVVLTIRWLKTGMPEERKGRWVYVLSTEVSVPAFVVLMLLLEMYFDDVLAQLFFGVPLPENPLPEPFFTRYIKSLLGRSELLPLSSTPSGFVLRQSLIALTGLFVLNQESLKLSKSWKNFLRFLLVISVIYISFARVARVTHTPMDVALALAVASLLFWGAVFIAASVSGVKIVEEYESSYTLFGFVLVIIMMMVSRKPGWWMLTLILVITTTWTTTRLLERIKNWRQNLGRV